MTSTSTRTAIPAPRTGGRTGSLRPVATPLAELSARLAPLCACAVDVLEVAAALEAEGVNDAVARRAYGAADVFALAERLYGAVQRRPPPTPQWAVPWRVRPLALVVRTAVFGLPGLPFVASAPLLGGSGAVVAVLVSLLLAWAVSEVLSHLGAVALARAGHAGAAAVLRWGACTGAVVLPVVLAAGLAAGAGTAGAAYAVGQAAYLLAATVLLVLGAERRLLVALLPGATVSLAALAGLVPAVTVALAAGLTVVAVAALAGAAVRGAGPLPRLWGELPAAASGGLFGLLAGALVTFGAAAALVTGGDVTGGALVALPVTLSMGAAEGLLIGYRRRTATALGMTGVLSAFARAARRALVLTVAAYLVVLVALAVAVAAGPASFTPARQATAVLLGGALFAALVLRSYGYTRVVLVAFGVALASEALLTPLGSPVEPAVAGALLVTLVCIADRVLRRASVHA